MKTPIFINSLHPSLYQMAQRAGHKIKEGGYTDDRHKAVILDGVKMPASQARTLLLTLHTYYTFNDTPCEV